MTLPELITKMGGLWNKIPVTYALMLIGSLALAGIYPFAGYFSKDLILEVAYANGSNAGRMAFTLGLVGAFCTAFYSWRLLFLTFHGECKYEQAHEAPRIMTWPLFILAIGAIFSGMLAVQMGILTAEFWGNSLILSAIIEKTHHLPALVKLVPLFASIAGILLAYLFYILSPELPKIFAHAFSGFYLVLQNKYYIDEIYEFIFVRPFKWLADKLWQIGDVIIIDGFGPNGFANISQRMSGVIARVQSGLLYHYILVMVIGLVGLITWYVFQ